MVASSDRSPHPRERGQTVTVDQPDGEPHNAPHRRARASSEGLSPDDYLEAAQTRAELRELLKWGERILRAHKLTPERYELLLAIKTAPDRRQLATVGWLAQVLNVAQSSVTQLVRRAEDAHLLRRQVSSGDARVRYLSLTRTGERRLAAALLALSPQRARMAALCAERAIRPHLQRPDDPLAREERADRPAVEHPLPVR
ncbi:MAG TPA: MarR family winged helix-turn-helix transcriptional regulator [Solirubrobacteraceae bacterium]|nr:MarR family winged helix-turn-helix transcriptional regulator [Solirubrobacteraceae bacterium]